MATLEKIRNKAGILVAVVIGLSLLAFVLGDFLSGKSSFLFTGSKTDVAKIAGKSIPVQRLEIKVKELEEIEKLKSGKTTTDESQMDRIREDAWQQLIYENVMEKEFERIGLTVSADELFDLIQGPRPSQMIAQLFTNPENGEFNRGALLNFLKATNEGGNATPEQLSFRLYLEKEVKTQRINNKYINLIRKGLSVPTFLAKNDYVEFNKKVDLKYIAQQFTSGSDNNMAISASDLKTYYKEHKYLYYNQAASRDVEYVSFDVVPSKADTTVAKEWIYKIRPDFVSATEVESFVNGNSDEPYSDKNFKEGELSDSLNIVMFKASVGEVYGPYFKDGAYRLARLNKIVNMPDSVKARHILIAPKGNDQPAMDKAKSTADSIKALLDKGADFVLLAKQFSADKSNSDKGGDLGWFTENKMVKPFNDAAFESKKGETKEVETNYGFHIIQVMERSPEKKKVKVAIILRKVVASKQTFDQIYQASIKFAGENRTRAQFNTAVEKQHLIKRSAANIGENDKTIPGVSGGNVRPLVDWVYNAEKNDISEPITIGDHYIIADLLEVKEKGTAPLEQVKNEVSLMVRKEKKANDLIEKINKAKAGVSSIENLAAKLKTPLENANGISFTSYTLPNSGVEPKIMAYATNLPKNKISPPIDGNNGVFVIYVSNVTDAPPIKDYTMSKQRLAGSLQGRASYESYNALIKLADISDNRRKFGF